MQVFKLKKEVMGRFVSTLLRDYNIVAPIKGSKEKPFAKPVFSEIKSWDEVFFDKKSYYSVKGFFFKNGEKIFNFDGNKIINPIMELKETVYFGLRRCDLNGIWHQDIVFLEDHVDPFYKARRDSSILIGYQCKEGDEYCFCNSFDLKDFFDLMFYDKKSYYAVEVGSEKGLAFVTKYSKIFQESTETISPEDKQIANKKRLDTINIKDDYNREEWKKGSDICISCGACNFLCMNCHCFDIDDEVTITDLNKGERFRKPASCQLRSFTRVAGDHIFRISRNARFKHRIYHQIQYFKDRHNVVFCTGCGRCIEGCPVRIDWVTMINEMKKQ